MYSACCWRRFIRRPSPTRRNFSKPGGAGIEQSVPLAPSCTTARGSGQFVVLAGVGRAGDPAGANCRSERMNFELPELMVEPPRTDDVLGTLERGNGSERALTVDREHAVGSV